jgi:hypothetical protein
VIVSAAAAAIAAIAVLRRAHARAISVLRTQVIVAVQPPAAHLLWVAAGVSLAADIVGDRRRLPEAAGRHAVLVLIDEDDHPDAYGSALAEQRRAMDPARAAFVDGVVKVLNRVGQPADLGCYAARPVG